MKPQYQYHHTQKSRRRARQRRHFMIVSIGLVSVAAIVSAAIFIGGKLVPISQSETKPKPSPTVSADAGANSSDSSKEESQSTTSQKEPSNSSKEESSTSSEVQVSVDPNGPAYQKKYPDLYVTDRPKMQVLEPGDKTVYLTFDDGPSDLTAPLLDILKKYDAKVTFFDCRQSDYQGEYSSLMKRCVDEGHAVAVHTYSHVMKDVYASVDAYLDDFYKMYKLIEETTGKKPANFFRFPGGSANSYNAEVREDIIKEMTRRGFIYYDWDGDSGDASGGNVSGATIYANTMDAIRRDCDIILMHNIFGKENTLSQIENILKDAQAEGYTFEALDGTLDPTHGYLMTNKIFIPAAMESPLIQLSDWRMEKEGKHADS